MQHLRLDLSDGCVAHVREQAQAEIRYGEDCQVCRLCQVYCPVDAVTITAGMAVPVMTAWG